MVCETQERDYLVKEISHLPLNNPSKANKPLFKSPKIVDGLDDLSEDTLRKLVKQYKKEI